MRRIVIAGLVHAVMACGLCACATAPPATPPSGGQPANVRLGPAVRLLATDTRLRFTPNVRAVVDQSGAAHVLIADAAHLRTVEVVVGADGTTEQRVIGSMKHGIQIGIRIPYGAIDGAFDERGSLHALVGDQHYVFVDGVWQAATHTPWEDAGIDVLVARFVRGASGLVWAMEVKGKDPVLMPLRRSA